MSLPPEGSHPFPQELSLRSLAAPPLTAARGEVLHLRDTLPTPAGPFQPPLFSSLPRKLSTLLSLLPIHRSILCHVAPVADHSLTVFLSRRPGLQHSSLVFVWLSLYVKVGTLEPISLSVLLVFTVSVSLDFSFCLFLGGGVFLGPYPRHMERPRLGVVSQLQPPAYTTATATATWDPSRLCDLHHSSRQHWIPNSLSEARDSLPLCRNRNSSLSILK